MFDNSGLSIEKYDNALAAWSAQAVNSGVVLGAAGVSYCESESARDDLINNDGWVITDSGSDCDAMSLAEVLEDSSSAGGSNNSNGTSITAAELALITGLNSSRGRF